MSIGNTRGPYTVRGNRISNNGRYGYHQHDRKRDGQHSPEIAVEGNDIWGNGLDGMRLEAPMLDATIVGNRIRNNGRRTEGAVSGQGPGAIYTDFCVRDAKAKWPVDGHKGKTLRVAGMTAVVASNTENELQLAPHRPGTATAWSESPPAAGTPYALPETIAIRPGLAVAAGIAGAWIRGNRIWDNQPHRTQTHDLWTAPNAECAACRIEND